MSNEKTQKQIYLEDMRKEAAERAEQFKMEFLPKYHAAPHEDDAVQTE